ncbi:hypothetical protein GCM10011387_16510 [Pedobacter quisquiliarum]|uniref:DUF4625 domain-containing protein n=1 Tax=Pedobacter quisquiliarum TaxID=1834438 RepID=A0A916U8D1_9SPHI|nr:DUF4625 domain-containing protein [Pedobacter quisquiliarum]GGC63585.1 hypothetical protein GCM10011387_16510 [Pedobacter quisquiliarum]
MKTIKTLLLIFLFTSTFVACKKDKVEAELASPMIENLEIGSGNNGQGVIGRDFHLDMDVTAGNKINTVQVQIKQRSGNTYPKEWSFELTWMEFKGLKNTNVHKHFTIPEDAPIGTYDFIIKIDDENGSSKEEKHNITLVSAESLPVNPEMYSLMLEKVDKGFVYILNRGFMLGDDKGYAKNEKLKAFVDVSKVKDQGIMYTLLIKKSAGHLPESVDKIDFSKVIVTDSREHTGLAAIETFTNYVGLPDFSPKEFSIGASLDNNIPAGRIDGEKAWANGEYFFGVVYTNKTHNMSAHYYIPLTISGF